MTETINFHMPEATPSIIMVAGVGGGGGNAVNHMYHLGIRDVSFMVCNTDVQALNRSQIPIKIVLGQSLTQGLGAGNQPDIGRAAAEESYEEIVELFKKRGTRMVFVTAGMGGGTGAGAAPIIAKAAKELDILTIAIVTLPFRAEGKKRVEQALKGIDEIREYVDSLLVIDNENIIEMYGELGISEAFGRADDILTTAAKGIAEIITGQGIVNVDFADVRAVMQNSGVALMGAAQASGENRADKAAQEALASPLLNQKHQDITGAKNILINITSGSQESTLNEVHYISTYIQEKAGPGYVADLIWGAGREETLGDAIKVTIIATGYANSSIEDFLKEKEAPLEQTPDPHPEPKQEAEEQEADSQEEENVTPPKRNYPVIEPEQPFTPRPQPNPVVQTPPRTGGRVTVVAGAGNSDGFVVVERDPVVTTAPQTEEDTINYDELERSPAFLRRKMTFDDVTPDGKSVSRVTLKDDSKQEKQVPQSNALFD